MAGVAIVAVGIFAAMQFNSAQDLQKRLGMAEFKLYCLERRDAYILGKGDRADNASAMEVCMSSFTNDQKALIPKA
jgi:hypothetical protein